MAKNYDDYGYEKSYKKSGSSIVRRVLIVLMLLLAIILIFVLIKGCKNRNSNKVVPKETFNYEEALLTAGKAYFANNADAAPSVPGQCSVVQLQSLVDVNLLSLDKFGNCNVTTTYVRVCVLENASRQYTPWLACIDRNSDTEYGPLAEGNLGQVITDESYTEFQFLPQVVKKGGERYGEVEELWQEEIPYEAYKTLSTTTYYRYRDKLYNWNLVKRTYYSRSGEKTKASAVSDYYTAIPASGYTKSSNKTTEAYKWYTTTSEKVYYSKDGAKMPSMEEPDGYPNRDPQGIDVTRNRYRTVTGTFAPAKYYVCAYPNTTNPVKYSPNPCTGSMNNQIKIAYSCVDGSSSTELVVQNVIDGLTESNYKNYKCKKYSDWSDWMTDAERKTYWNKLTQTQKDNTQWQKVTFTLYYWYKLVGGVNTYYPSGATKAGSEGVYYIEAPVKGAVKDTSTKTTAYKWYKESKSTTTKFTALPPDGYYSATKSSEYEYTDWSDWSTKNPKTSDGREREIEKKTKIKLQQNLGSETDGWNSLSNEYMTEGEMISLFKEKGYNVNTLQDITNNGEIRYSLKLFLRNKKETK